MLASKALSALFGSMLLASALATNPVAPPWTSPGGPWLQEATFSSWDEEFMEDCVAQYAVDSLAFGDLKTDQASNYHAIATEPSDSAKFKHASTVSMPTERFRSWCCQYVKAAQSGLAQVCKVSLCFAIYT